MNFHHIGYAVKQIDEAFKCFKLLGFSISSDIVEDTSRQVRICFIENKGVIIELIEPMNDKSPISNILSKNGPTPYHICIEVERLLTVFPIFGNMGLSCYYLQNLLLQ